MTTCATLTIQQLLDRIPSPASHFADRSRTVTDLYKEHTQSQLVNDFQQLIPWRVLKVMDANNGLYFPSYRALVEDAVSSAVPVPPRCVILKPQRPQQMNDDFELELFYTKHQDLITAYIKECEEAKQRKLENARKNGELITCPICFDTEVLPEDSCTCASGHAVCVQCLRRGIEVSLKEDRIQHTCLHYQCTEIYPLVKLQLILNNQTFKKLVTRLEREEELVRQTQSRFMEKSGRPVHWSGCDSRIDAITLRKYVHLKMSEAIIRTCPRCGRQLIKEVGCNSIFCLCKTEICYVCRKPVERGDHFDLFLRVGGETRAGCNKHNDNNKVLQQELVDAARTAIQEYLDIYPEETTKWPEKDTKDFLHFSLTRLLQLVDERTQDLEFYDSD